MTNEELTKHSERLNHEFNLDGYVSIPAFFSAEELAEINENKERFIRDVVPTMPESEVYYDDKSDLSTLKQLQLMWKYDSFFDNLMAPDSKLSQLAEICLEDKARKVNMQYFNKSPNSNTPTPPHQDGYFFHLIPNNAITIWVALQDVEPEQGCVNYVQGSHKYGMRAHGSSGTLGFSQTILDFGLPYDMENAKAFPCKAGHLIAHHSLTTHWASGNTSGDKARQAMGAIYYGDSCVENKRSKANYQAQLDASLAAQGKL